MTFNFSNAILHFARTGGPKGFLWKFALAYSVLGLLIGGISMAAQWPVYQVYIRMISEGGDIGSYVDEINRASMNSMGFSALLMPVGLLFWVVFEAASQRRYMRGEGFTLKLGGDEGRLAVVLLIWIAMFIAWYIGFFVLMMIFIFIGAMTGMAGGGESAGIIAAVLAVLAMLAAIYVLLWGAARFSPASSMTIRDKQIRFFEAWRITRKKSGTIIFALLVLYLLSALLALIFLGPVFFYAFSQFAPLFTSGGEPSANDMIAIASRPAFYVPLAAGYGLYMIIAAAWFHVFGGPAALAAKTDPNWNGREGVSSEFS